jgi:hypothetical protein
VNFTSRYWVLLPFNFISSGVDGPQRHIYIEAMDGDPLHGGTQPSRKHPGMGFQRVSETCTATNAGYFNQLGAVTIFYLIYHPANQVRPKRLNLLMEAQIPQ